MLFTGRSGTLRIYDSTLVKGNKAAANSADIVVYDDSETSYTNKYTEAWSVDASYTGEMFVAENDAVYVGCTRKFSMIRISGGAGGTYCTGGGALRIFYYNGTDWTSEIASGDITDETYASDTTFSQAEAIGFKAPEDWTIGQGGLTDLDTDKYYVKLMTTTVPSVAPTMDYLVPADNQYIDVIFADMNFDGPLGRSLTEEMLILNRGTMDGNYAHYIEGGDNSIYDPIQITFSFKADDTWNRGYVFDAMTGTSFNLSAANGYWAAGNYTSSKGDTENDGTNANPTFADSDKKCCNVQMLWDQTGGNFGMAYYETYFPEQEIKVTEADDGVTVSCTGYVYGVIEEIHQLGCRYT